MPLSYLDPTAWRDMLQSHNWAGYVALTPEHIFLQAGFLQPLHMHTNPRIPVTSVATTDRIALVIPRIQLAYLSQASIEVDVLVTFGEFDIRLAGTSSSDEARALAELISHENRARSWSEGVALACRRLGLDDGVLAHDETGLSDQGRELLRASVRVPMVGGIEAFREVRRCKTDRTLGIIGEAVRITEESLVETVSAVRPGITQKELHHIYRSAVGRRGGVPGHVGIGVGSASVFPINLPIPKRIDPGDLIRLDVGALYGGFFADTARVVSVGPPTAATCKTYDALLAGETAAVRQVRAGARTSRIFHAAVDTVREVIKEYKRPHTGHAIGVSRYEIPLIAPEPDEPIGVGEVVNVEVPLYDFEQGGFNIEDTVVVKPEGPVVLTSLPRELLDAGEFLQRTRATKSAHDN